MFLRADIQSVLDGTATFKHVATLNSPYSFEIRPSGFKRGEPNYRVLVEQDCLRIEGCGCAGLPCGCCSRGNRLWGA